MIDVVVAGSLHLDVVVEAPRLPHLDETLVGRSVDYRLGGKGANQAVAAARMKARTAMAGQVGSDRFADQILAELDAAGVDRRHVVKGAGESGMSVAIVDDDGSYGAVVVSAANLGFVPPAGMLDGNPRIVCLQNEIPEHSNRTAAAGAKNAGARVILNAAPARRVDPSLAALVDILVVNRIEAEAMTGVACPERAARLLSSPEMDAVIVTLGAEGLLLSSRGNIEAAFPAVPVKVQSTHGAGDMFVGALAAELADGSSLLDALPIAQAAAALHVSTPANARNRICRQAAIRLAAESAGGEILL